ncbi:MAG: polyprenyl synthetase family protein, partial [bacterium]
MSSNHYFDGLRKQIEAELDRVVPPERVPPETIHRAMRYSLFAGGKRIRPILCLEAARAVSVEAPGVERAA